MTRLRHTISRIRISKFSFRICLSNSGQVDSVATLDESIVDAPDDRERDESHAELDQLLARGLILPDERQT